MSICGIRNYFSKRLSHDLYLKKENRQEKKVLFRRSLGTFTLLAALTNLNTPNVPILDPIAPRVISFVPSGVIKTCSTDCVARGGEWVGGGGSVIVRKALIRSA